MGLLERIFGDADLFNPNHEPPGSDKGGQFAPAREGSGSQAPVASDAQAKIGQREREIAAIKDHEVLYAVLRNGQEVKVDGTSNRVNLSMNEMDSGKWRGAVVTHNHPVTGNSFTPEDIYATHRGGFGEMHAVADLGGGNCVRYSIKPEASFFRQTIRQQIEDESASVFRENKKKIKAGTMTVDEADRAHYDMVWRRLDKALDGIMHYKVEAFNA